MKKTVKKVNVWFWRLALALGFVGVVLSQVKVVAASPLLSPLPPVSDGYVWGE